MAKTKRKPMGQKLRFEVFKRDAFTCQYCGRKAPNVLLEVDHIKPVFEGGDNSLINLVTSCRDCNRGKGKRELSDSSMVEKQTKQLEENQEKENQLKMMIEWKEGQTDILDEQVEYFNGKLKELTGYKFSDSYKNKLKGTIKKVGFDNMYDSFEVCKEQYYSDNKNSYSDEICSKLTGCACNLYYKKVNPEKADIRYFANILKNKLTYFDTKSFYTNFPTEYNINDKEDVLRICNKAKSWTNFFNELEIYYER